MNIKELKNYIISHKKYFQGYVELYHPFDIIKMRYKNILELRFPTQVYHIEQSDGNWNVYMSERGAIFENQVFVKEEEACTYFKNLILRITHSRK